MRYLLLASGLVMTMAICHSAEVDFSRDVLPILRDHCLDCHGTETQESTFRIDSMVGALTGGNSGEPAVVPGKSDQSHLIRLVTSEDDDERMPPDAEPLSKRQIDVLRSWIDEEAAWQPARDQRASRKVEHWSMQPVVRPAVPPSDSPHAIDAFIDRRLATSELKRSANASRRRLIRRLHLVMHGLPPTPEQVESFVHDTHPDAWESLVEEVLKSTRYGERFATHWLDLVRFGETHGFETNRERPHAWRYRDWVIDAFNADKAYDDFVFQQIAGDTVNEDVGTGFLVAGPYDLVKGQDPKLGLIQRQDELADMINTTGTAFMGLTLGCARCHNHKFDPVSQTDYYSLQAVFAGVNHADRKLPLDDDVRKELAKSATQENVLRERLEKFVSKTPLRDPVSAKRNVEEFSPVDARFVRMTIQATTHGEPCIDELEIFAGEENVALASSGATASSSGDFVHPLHKLAQINDGEYGNSKSWISKSRRDGWVQIELAQRSEVSRIVWARDRLGNYSDRLATQYVIEVSLDQETWLTVASSADRAAFSKEVDSGPNYDFDSFPPEQAAEGRKTLAEIQRLVAKRKQLETGELAYAGTFSQPGPTHRLYRGEPDAKREQVSPDAIAVLGRLGLSDAAPERDRRVALAKWIVHPQHPLTARVMVNRLWHFHFGTGVVDTPSDFGGNGSSPSHPELLDWLAAEFVESGWSIKHLQRLILTSQTWRQDSRPSIDAMRVDASTRLLWRFPPRRLEAEGIRDGILSVTGKLDFDMGGPGFSAFEVDMENVRHYHPKQSFDAKDWRRMIYMTKVRQERDAVFGVFDCPDGSQVTPKRSRSTTPLQALNLLNSRFVMQQAEILAERLRSERSSSDEQVRRAYQLCFSRPADRGEIDRAVDFIRVNGLVQFCRAMFNANEFLFIP